MKMFFTFMMLVPLIAVAQDLRTQVTSDTLLVDSTATETTSDVSSIRSSRLGFRSKMQNIDQATADRLAGKTQMALILGYSGCNSFKDDKEAIGQVTMDCNRPPETTTTTIIKNN